MSKKNPLHVVGIDTEGKPVMGGLFQMADTYGVPLADAIIQCRERGWTPGLWDYIQCAEVAGWPRARAVKRVIESCRDAGWHEAADWVSENLGGAE